MTQHTPYGGSSARDIEEKRTLDNTVRHLAAGYVRVHLGQPRQEKLALSVHPQCPGGNLCLARGTHRNNPIALDHHGGTGQGPFSIHWDDGYVYECDQRIRRGRRLSAEEPGEAEVQHGSQLRAAAARLERSNSFMNETSAWTDWREHAL